MAGHAKTMVLAAAFGPKLVGIASKLTKSVKAVKAGLAGASVIAYSWLFSWEFALLLLMSLVIHEYGHVWAMRSVGIPTRGFYLIPFVGGAAVPERAFGSRLDELFVALAGPAFGLAQAALFYVLYVAYGHPLLGAAAGWVAVLNLVNLIPITPLDGGRIVKCATMSIGSRAGMSMLLAGILFAVLAMIALRSWMIGIIALFSLFEFMFERRTHRFTPDPYLKRMTSGQTVGGLAGYLVVMMALGMVVYGCLAIPEVSLAMSILQDR